MNKNLVIQVIGWWLMALIVNFQKFVKILTVQVNVPTVTRIVDIFIRYSDAKYNRYLDILIMDHLKGVC